MKIMSGPLLDAGGLSHEGIGATLLLLAVACGGGGSTWILLPFSMAGIKPLLRELIAATRETNRLLAAAQQAPTAIPADKLPPT
jgi:hypothetical protein